ncbi:MAG: sulfatase-like hydrolase/transferase [Thermoanaerobaculia bacterium]
MHRFSRPPAGSLLSPLRIRAVRRALLISSLLIAAAGCDRTKALPSHGDILLVTIDTLRADSLGHSSGGRVATPWLDRLAAGGVSFPGAHAHNVATLPSHANILTGRLPYEHGVRDNGGFALPRAIPTLATLLHDAGYATGAFVGAFPLERRFGLDAGFDRYDDEVRGAASRNAGAPAERRGDRVVERALAWWNSSRVKPRFLWLHFYDPHAPYEAPEPFASRYPDEPYLAEIAALDSYLAPLLEPHLEGRAAPATIVVTADHGEALGEHGETTHGVFAYEATLHVPLLLWGEGIAPAVDPRLAQHIDIAPTLLERAGLGTESFRGHSLLRPAREKPLYFEALSASFSRGWAPLTGILVDGFKWIELPEPELYDLERDPTESHNLAALDVERAQRLRALLPRDTLARQARADPDATAVRELASLGYLAGATATTLHSGLEDDPKRRIADDRRLHGVLAAAERGDLQQAVELATALVTDRPRLAAAYEGLARALRALDRIAEAARWLALGIERGADRNLLVPLLADALLDDGRAAEAAELLRPFGGSSDPDVLCALGDALSRTGETDAASDALRRAEALRPDDPRILQAIGFAALRSSDVVVARDLFERALALDSGLATSWNGLGVAQERAGDRAAALRSFARAIEVDPREWNARLNLGLVAAAAGEREQARAALADFVARVPARRHGDEIAQARAVLRELGRR